MNLKVGAAIAMFVSALQAANTPPSIGRVVTETIYPGGDYPEERVVQGSRFRLDGSDLADPANASAGYPLPLQLGGASIRIISGGESFDALICSIELLRFEDGIRPSIHAILPSGVPVGDALMVVSRHGEASREHTIRITRRDFGLYSVAQNIDSRGGVRTNSFSESARPGQAVSLWGTGLGAVDGDEATPSLAGDILVPGLQVLLGGMDAKVLYAGRSGCCAGIDQVIFEVPPGVAGCNVPVQVRYATGGALGAHQTGYYGISIAISASGDTCSDPFGTPGPLSYGAIRVSETRFGGPATATFGMGGADTLPPTGTCGNLLFPQQPASRDAGPAIHIDTPQNRIELKRHDVYTSAGATDTLPPGVYVATNDTGGSAIGPFRASTELPATPFVWLNQESTRLQREEDLGVTWSGGRAGGYVIVQGQLSVGGFAAEPGGPLIWQDPQGWFSCMERVEKGVLVVPASAIWNEFTRTADKLELTVTHVAKDAFQAPGLDMGEFILEFPRHQVISLR